MIKEKWVLYLTGEAGNILLGFIEGTTENKYWKTLKDCLTEAKEKIPSWCRIGGNFFTSITFIGRKLYSNNPKNMNRDHKEIRATGYIYLDRFQ